MSPETRMSMSLRKRPCWNRYPDRSGTRFPSTTGPAMKLVELISPIFAFRSVSEDAARRHDILLPGAHQPNHPPSRG